MINSLWPVLGLMLVVIFYGAAQVKNAFVLLIGGTLIATGAIIIVTSRL